MKKMILTAAMAICTVGLFAQNTGNTSSGLANKKGEMYLPEAGDWAISFDATPFLSYVGNMFNSSTNNNAFAQSVVGANNCIIGKYFVDPNTAYRAIVRIGIQSNSWTNLTTQDIASSATPPNPPISASTVNDKLSVSTHFIGLGAGMEKRRGHTRLQGYYGAELMFWLASGFGGDSTMTYGNSWASTNTGGVATFYNFHNASVEQYGSGFGSRITKDSPGSIFGISLLGFIGVEYFVFPKISLGAEYTWGLNFWSQGEGSMTQELVYTPSSGTPTDASFTTKTGGKSHFGLDTGVNGIFGNSNAGSADITLTFHF